jgi:hypothetical protein
VSRGKVRYDMGYGYGREWTVVDDNCERARGGREEERRRVRVMGICARKKERRRHFSLGASRERVLSHTLWLTLHNQGSDWSGQPVWPDQGIPQHSFSLSITLFSPLHTVINHHPPIIGTQYISLFCCYRTSHRLPLSMQTFTSGELNRLQLYPCIPDHLPVRVP